MLANATIQAAAVHGGIAEVKPLFDGGSTIEIRDGTPPAATTDADAGTLLATLTMSGTAFGTPSGGVIAANAIAPDTSAVAGTPSYFRIKNPSAVVLIQGTVGTSGTDMIVDTSPFPSGNVVNCSALTVTASYIP